MKPIIVITVHGGLVAEVIPPLNKDDNPDETTAQRDPCDQSNARPIVAAVNACKGISTEALEQGVVREFLESLHDLLGEGVSSKPARSPTHYSRNGHRFFAGFPPQPFSALSAQVSLLPFSAVVRPLA